MFRQHLLKGVVLSASLFVVAQVMADEHWKPYPEGLYKPDLSGDNIVTLWPKLARATGDPLPEDPGLLDAWRSLFEGDFATAKCKGLALGTADGKYVAYRAQTLYALYMAPDPIKGKEEESERTVLLKEAADVLSAAVQLVKDDKKEPSPQLVFWRTYAQGRYVQIMKPTWGLLTKKAKVQELLTQAGEVKVPPSIPALHALYGGTYSAIYDDGLAARLSFRSYVRDCQGQEMTGEYVRASMLRFECAIVALGDSPLPEVYNSYAHSLLELDANANRDRAQLYKQYATGVSIPPDVTNMVFSAEDALAREAAKSVNLKWQQSAAGG